MSFIIELVKQYLTGYGIWGVGLGMMLESLGVPVVSTVLELSAGPLILSGSASPITVILIADAGLVTGSVISYALGYYGFKLIKKAEKKELYTKRELELKKKIVDHCPRVIYFAQFL